MKRFSPVLFTVGFRYVAIGLQFLILTLIARNFGLRDYGLYLFVLSAVLPLYSLLGFGASETVVRDLPCLAADDQLTRARMAGTTLGVTLINALIVLMLAAALGLVVARGTEDRVVLWFMAGFFVANGVMFNCAQLLLAGGRKTLGGFFYYPAVNLSLIAVSVPYIVFSPERTFAGLALTTTLGPLAAAGAALSIVLREFGRPRLEWLMAIRLMGTGIRLAITRILYAVGLWLPTFLAGILLTPSDAGVLGTAGRFAAAVSALIAAIRFAVRPAIVSAAARGDMQAIRSLCGRLGAATTGAALLAFVASLALGGPLIGAILGAQFYSVAPVLAILLVAVAAECFGGPVDEVLKMTGRQDLVLALFTIGVTLLGVAILLLGRSGVIAIALAQLCYTVIVFGALILATRRHLGIWLYPSLPRFSRAIALPDSAGVAIDTGRSA